MASRAQIVATIGPSCANPSMIASMVRHGVDVVRINFSWGDDADKIKKIEIIREAEKEIGREIIIMQDLPGPRIQKGSEHTYDNQSESSFTDDDKNFIKIGAEHNLNYAAVSFVSNEEDILNAREAVKKFGGRQKIIAKIERSKALENIDKIIDASDAIMIARGDMGNEVPLEKIPFVQADIIKKCKLKNKPVITATQMLISMTLSKSPTRAEVTDVASAILMGSDAVMLSEETARGKYPLEAVMMMEKIVLEAEAHLKEDYIPTIL